MFMLKQKIALNGKNLVRIVSPSKVEVVANSCLKLYGSMIRGVTDACGTKDSKVGGQKFQQECLGG